MSLLQTYQFLWFISGASSVSRETELGYFLVVDSAIWFRTICQKNGFPISDKQLVQLTRFVDLLLQWNKKINLISRRDEQNIWVRHILHSVCPLFHHRLKNDATAMDLGTGGGLPGIPLSIVSPNLQITLVDSIQKKIKAVAEMVSELRLDTAETVCGRAEDLVKSTQLRKRFDYVLSRAVAPLDKLVEWAKPFLRTSDSSGETGLTIPPAALIVWKGGDVASEVKKAEFRGSKVRVESVAFEGSENLIDSDKKIIVVRF